MRHITFEKFWATFHNKSLADRRRYFDSLSSAERKNLINSFTSEGWRDLFVQNIIDCRLDYVKQTYGLDLIDLRIQAVKFKKIFLVQTSVWEMIEDYLLEFASFYNSDIIFGGLVVRNCVKNPHLCRIKSA